jgi:hypothetical protein
VFGVDAMEMRAMEAWWGREGEVGNLGYQNWKEKPKKTRTFVKEYALCFITKENREFFIQSKLLT